MVDQGARHLVLLQRSELPSGKAIDAVKALEGAGAQVHLLAANVADSGELDRKLGALLPSLPPLRGVVHAAGILDDGILLQMSEERFANVMAPKLGGAANLHRLTRELPLDFFVVFSSVAGLLGSPGQGNYGAANAGLDALAHYRRGIGLPALSLDWGPWAKVGMAAADERRGERVGQHGIGSIPPERGVVLFQSLLEAEEAQLAVVPVDVPKLIASWPEAARQPLLAELTRAMRDPAGAAASVDTAAHEEPSAVRDAFEAAEPAERRRVLSEYVTREMARVLQLAPAELDMRRPLNTLGIDSLMAVELRNRLESDLPVRVQIASLLEGSSPDDLVNKLLSQLPDGAQPPADRITAAVRTVRELSDEEVRALLAEKKKEAERRRSTEGS
jgi:acyl carrier protein